MTLHLTIHIHEGPTRCTLFLNNLFQIILIYLISNKLLRKSVQLVGPSYKKICVCVCVCQDARFREYKI